MKRLAFALLMLTACSQQKEVNLFDELQWIDLTHSFDSSTIYWPNNLSGFQHITDAKGITPTGYFYSSYQMATPEHGGTHLDAPIHFYQEGLTVDEIPLSSLTGNAVIIDVSENALKNRDYLISIQDVEKWEKEHGPIAPNTIVLFRTGYGDFYPDRAKVLGTDMTGVAAIPMLHFPGVDPATTQWLLEKRNIKALGVDTPSTDYGQSKEFKTHQILHGQNKPGFENLAHLDKLPAVGAYVVALPMKIGKGSGGPLRIIAHVPVAKD
ncbi:MAG: cyclase family protein [Bacteroidota bacterium]